MSKGRRRFTENEARRIGLKFDQKHQQQYGFVSKIEKPEREVVRLKPKTPNQHACVRLIESSDVSFILGSAGVGKTHVAVGMADRYLLEEQCEKVIICRAAVGVGRTTGFLPGKLDDKLAPFLRPIFDEYNYFRGNDVVRKLMKQEIIEIASLEHIQGRTLRNAMIVLDEAQNTTHEEMWHFLTRLGEGSKMIIVGDPSQSVLPHHEQGALQFYSDLFRNAPRIGVVYMTKRDIVRHPVVANMISIREQYESESQQT